ncbi:MAG: hypothetical protein PUA49_03890 [Butyrivibrio sp.]|nr:hypothetical protein [Butyrivibrio sp.]
MNNELQNQMKNKEDAISAAKDFIDCFFNATPEFKEQIRRATVGLLVAKSQINPDANQFLNWVIEFRNFLISLGI